MPFASQAPHGDGQPPVERLQGDDVLAARSTRFMGLKQSMTRAAMDQGEVDGLVDLEPIASLEGGLPMIITPSSPRASSLSSPH
jgi:hypothetical protein